MASLKDLFDKARAASEHRSWVRGLIGKPDGTISVPDRPTHVYVRVSQQGGESVTTARNMNTVPNRLNLPVRMRVEPGAGYVITGIDSSYYDAATVNDTVNDYGLTYHTHKIGSGMEYEMEAMRLEPGRVYPTGSWGVTVNPFRYWYNGAWVTYEGEDLDLLANRPSTTGKHRLVVISINPLTNAANKTNGSDQNYATDLGQADIDVISIGDNIPLCAVLIRADDTSIEDITRFIDAGGWRNRGATALDELVDVALTSLTDNDVLTYDSGDGVWKNQASVAGVTFNDAEGQPADVTSTAADGTSTYAARRDHAHTIAAGTVTASMMQDGAVLSEILDDDGHGSGLDADLLDGNHATAFATAAHSHITFDDTEGQPADVAGTNADGTSSYAARRDHAHTIGSGVVTAGMLANSYSLSTHTHAGTVAAVSIITDWSYRSSSRSSSLYAWKGNEFKPDRTIYLYALGYFGGLVASAVYKAAVMTGTASPGNIATVTFSDSYTMPGSPNSTDGGWIWLEFATPVTLSAGTTYGLMLGRTDGSDTYALPVPANGSTAANNAVPMQGQSHGAIWRVAKANPVAGDTIDRTTVDSIGCGFRYRYDSSRY